MAAEAIRGKIVRGELQLGEALTEGSLAQDLGVSKTPVREALLALKREGLVEVRPRVGTFVFQMSAVHVQRLSEMREILETAAVGYAITRNRKALLKELGTVVARMEAALKRSDFGEYRSLDGRFHHAFLTNSHNPYLVECHSLVAFRVQALRNRLSLDANLNRASLREHQRLVQLIEANEIDEARFLLRAHIRKTEEHYLKLLEQPATELSTDLDNIAKA